MSDLPETYEPGQEAIDLSGFLVDWCCWLGCMLNSEQPFTHLITEIGLVKDFRRISVRQETSATEKL